MDKTFAFVFVIAIATMAIVVVLGQQETTKVQIECAKQKGNWSYGACKFN